MDNPYKLGDVINYNNITFFKKGRNKGYISKKEIGVITYIVGPRKINKHIDYIFTVRPLDKRKKLIWVNIADVQSINVIKTLKVKRGDKY